MARVTLLLLGLALSVSVGCKALAPSKKTDTVTVSEGAGFTLDDDSSAVPTRGRPHAFKKATIQVVVPAAEKVNRIGVSFDVDAATSRPNARMKLTLTDPEGQKHDGFKSANSGLAFCPKPGGCTLTYQLLMTYDGLPGPTRSRGR